MRRCLTASATVLFVALVAGSCSWFGTDVGVDGVDVGIVEIDGQHGRDAVVVAPKGHRDDPVEKLPLVVVLHGLGGNGLSFAQETEWPRAARDRGFVAAFPQGFDESWNAGRCCGAAVGDNVNDVAFIDALINQMVAEENVDPERIYMAGFSNGGMFTFLYACLAPGLLAGAASVAGTNFSDCEPDGSVDFLQVSGRDDPVVPVLGGESSLTNVPEVPSVEQSLLDMAAAAGCDDPKGFEVNGVMSFQDGGCEGGTSVRFDVLEGFGHQWPGEENSPNYVAVDKITEFWGL
ncbi:MAG: alpha/beta fold hydrolase [Actinomycetia bacterium]|nr:alpha/beta fold hydrolase [Actinomycetes bacterium]